MAAGEEAALVSEQPRPGCQQHVSHGCHDDPVFGLARPGELMVAAGPRQAPITVPLDEFSDVSAVRWCERRKELFATAAPAGHAKADMLSRERGDLRLFRCDPVHGTWQQVHRRYSHDPLRLPDGGYVVYRGAGLTFLDENGTMRREVKVGRFAWAPPSLSVNPSEDTVAWTRWEGGSGRLRIENLTTEQSTQLRTSVSRYAWLDPHTIIYLHGAGLRLMDITTGTACRFSRSLRDHTRAGMPTVTPELWALAQHPADQLWEFYHDVQVVDGQVWISATLTEQLGNGRVDGLFRANQAGEQFQLVTALPPNQRIEGFYAWPDHSALVLTATYQGTTIMERGRIAIGPMAEFLDAGWGPILTSHEPTFGVHGLPSSQGADYQ